MEEYQSYKYKISKLESKGKINSKLNFLVCKSAT
jgi:hypothetical protein